MTQSMMATPSFVEDKPPPDLMTTSMHSLSGDLKKGLTKRPQSHRNDTSQQWFNFSDENEGRQDMAASAKEREDKVRRLRESQEEERKKKLEELKAHALNSQKFREQQENERRRHIEDLRSKDQDRRCQVEERRKEIEKAENERREALLLRNKEREERITTQRKNSRNHIEFAFGSSAPRLLEPRIDSGYWGSRRGTSTTNMYSPGGDRNSAEREADLRNKRTVSAQGLDRSTEGDDDGLVGGFGSTAHRRRTDLVPTIVMPRGEWSGSRSATPSKMRSPGRAVSMSRIDTLSLPRRPLLHDRGGAHGARTSPSKSVSMSHLASGRSRTKTADPRRPPLSLLTNQNNGGPKMRPRSKTSGAKTDKGISRENTSTASRPGSAMSGGSGPPRPVRLRSAPSRRPRPTSIATTGMSGSIVSNGGMTASMYEERQRPQAHVPRQKSLGGSGTPKLDRMKRARSVTSEAGADDDARSTTSSVGPSSKTPARKTPAQVKADAAARKLKATQAAPSTPKTSLGQKDAAMKKSTNSKSPSPSLSTENVRGGAGDENRLTTPDIIKNNHKEEKHDKEEKESTPDAEGDKEQKNVISSEEESKLKIALKRKEMKEKKEREEELERQRQLELERIEEERRVKEEEEERKMMEEADKMAVDARRAEEERIQKAIEEADSEKKRQEEEEERLKIEKEEIERKTKEEAEKREAELQEKLKKEEEERLARKKRIEEIMARTRGKGATPNTTPKKEVEPQGSPASQPTSLDTNVDPTKPDLLGDINHDNVAAQNAKNIEVSAPQNGFEEASKNGEADVEKGALDSLSKADLPSDEFITKPVIHGMDLENSKPRSPSPLNDAADNTMKSGPAVTEGSQFDQLIDLGAMADTNKAEMPDHQPIMAFEDSIPSPRQQQNTAELLS